MIKVFYHGNCLDGFTAAWAVRSNLPNQEAQIEYIPVGHGQEAPDVTGCTVMLLDFAYPRETLIRMAGQATGIRVLDHHKTAQADLEGLDFCTFDMNRSGAGMAWDWMTSEPRPKLVDYVEDRDLWRWSLPNSREVNAYISTVPLEFEAWDALRAELECNLSGIVQRGATALRVVERYVREMAKQARTVVVFDGREIPIVNAPYINTSELVGHLAESAEFAIGWFQRSDGRYAYSLRSRGDFDVSVFAKSMGGGGHRSAAGFVSDYTPEHLFGGTRKRETAQP